MTEKGSLHLCYLLFYSLYIPMYKGNFHYGNLKTEINCSRFIL